jgi:hypothetical protein
MNLLEDDTMLMAGGESMDTPKAPKPVLGRSPGDDRSQERLSLAEASEKTRS